MYFLGFDWLRKGSVNRGLVLLQQVPRLDTSVHNGDFLLVGIAMDYSNDLVPRMQSDNDTIPSKTRCSRSDWMLCLSLPFQGPMCSSGPLTKVCNMLRTTQTAGPM